MNLCVLGMGVMLLLVPLALRIVRYYQTVRANKLAHQKAEESAERLREECTKKDM
jgi:hypothetical protein